MSHVNFFKSHGYIFGHKRKNPVICDLNLNELFNCNISIIFNQLKITFVPEILIEVR